MRVKGSTTVGQALWIAKVYIRRRALRFRCLAGAGNVPVKHEFILSE